MKRANAVAAVRREGNPVHQEQDVWPVRHRASAATVTLAGGASRPAIRPVSASTSAIVPKRKLDSRRSSLDCCARQIDIVPETRQPRRTDNSRLLRIDFPGMHIERKRLARAVQAGQRPASQAERIQPKVAAARNRQLPTAPAAGWPAGTPKLGRRAFAGWCSRGSASGNAVAVVASREDAGVEREAFLDQDFEGPQRAAGDRESWVRDTP